MDMVALLNLTLHFRCKRPVLSGYPVNPTTLGEHLRKKRMDIKLTKKALSLQLNVDEMTVGTWESDRHVPPPKHYANLIKFIGYLPFDTTELSLGKQIYYARLIAGLSQEMLSKSIGVDESNIRLIELEKRKPQKKTKEELMIFVKNQFKKFNTFNALCV